MLEQPIITTENPQEILKQKGIFSFDVNLTTKEKESIQDIRIEQGISDFDHYGTVDETLVQKLQTHFDQLEGNSEETTRTIAALIARITKDETRKFKKDSVWLAVRTSLPNDDWELPRWHTDGGFVKDEHGKFLSEEYKLVFAVKGAPTRFATIIDQKLFAQYQQEEYANNMNLLENSGVDPEIYEKYALLIRTKLIHTVQEIFPTKEGQATLYRVGGPQAQVHSEPPIHEPRIFMSVVTGSVEQIKELQERFTKKRIKERFL